MIYEAPILSDCAFFVYESHFDQQPVMVNGLTVNTHTRTSAACFEFLRMISFRCTFFSDYRRRMKKIELPSGIYDCSRILRYNTHLEPQCVHLFVRDFPWTLCPLLLRRPLVQLCLVQPEGGERFLKAPSTNDNKEVLFMCLGVKSLIFHTKFTPVRGKPTF